MTTLEYRRSVCLWGDWELLHLGGREYELLQLCGKIWFSHRRFRVVDDTAALKRVRELVASTDQKIAFSDMLVGTFVDTNCIAVPGD